MHNSIEDARACIEYLSNNTDKMKSIVAMDKIWMVKCTNHEKHDEEAKRHVPVGWKEDDTTIWELLAAQSYTSVMGGLKKPGPSIAINTTIANQTASQCDLVALFLYFWPIHILNLNEFNILGLAGRG